MLYRLSYRPGNWKGAHDSGLIRQLQRNPLTVREAPLPLSGAGECIGIVFTGAGGEAWKIFLDQYR